MSPSVALVPRLTFGHIAWMKLQALLTLSKREISGFGKVISRDHDFFVEDIFVLTQRVSSSETVISPEAVAGFLTELVEKGEDPGLIKLWWHSHANSGLFWSGIDHTNMRSLTRGFMFGLVGDDDGNVKVRLDLTEPIPLVIDEIPVHYDAADEETIVWAKAEMRKKVSFLPRPPAKPKIVAIVGDDLPDEVYEELLASAQEGDGGGRASFRIPEDAD